jgi:tetratricopeptide (TPR) repeat protein
MASRRWTWRDRLNVWLAIVAIIIGVLSIGVTIWLSVVSDRTLRGIQDLADSIERRTTKIQRGIGDLNAFTCDSMPNPPPPEPSMMVRPSEPGLAALYDSAADAVSAHRNPQAETLLCRLIEASPGFAPAYLWLGVVRATLGESSGALRVLTMALSIDSTMAEAHSYRAALLNGRGSSLSALRDFKAAMKFSSDSITLAACYMNWGLSYMSAGQTDSALKYYWKAAAMNPRDEYVYSNLAIGYQHVDRQKAESLAGVAIELNPSDADAYALRGGIRLDMGRSAAAVKDFSRAIALDPGETEFWFNRSVAYDASGELNSAEADLMIVMCTDSTFAKAAANLGLVLARTGRPEEARRYFELAIRHGSRLPGHGAERVEMWLEELNETGRLSPQ